MQNLSSHFPLFLYNKIPSLLDICSSSLLSSHSLLSFTPLGFHLHDVMRILFSKWPQPPLFQIQESILSPPVSWHLSSESACELTLPIANIVFTWFGSTPLFSFLPALQAGPFQSLGWFFIISLSSKWSCVLGLRPQTSSNLIQPDGFSYHPYTDPFSFHFCRSGLFPELQTSISISLFHISNWMAKKHFKLNTTKIKSLKMLDLCEEGEPGWS